VAPPVVHDAATRAYPLASVFRPVVVHAGYTESEQPFSTGFLFRQSLLCDALRCRASGRRALRFSPRHHRTVGHDTAYAKDPICRSWWHQLTVIDALSQHPEFVMLYDPRMDSTIAAQRAR